MEQHQKDIVHGYVRLNYKEFIMDDIINIIYMFYLIRMASNILDMEEQTAFINSLFHRLKQQHENQNIMSIATNLLFRASDNGNNCDKFHEKCDNKGATITIIHNEHNHIFGGYTSKPWQTTTNYFESCKKDPFAFLFIIRPMAKFIAFNDSYADGEQAIRNLASYGPTFGTGFDIWVRDRTKKITVQVYPRSFNFNMAEMSGGKIQSQVIDFEVFAIHTK